jgi:hypothetical protein
MAAEARRAFNATQRVYPRGRGIGPAAERVDEEQKKISLASTRASATEEGPTDEAHLQTIERAICYGPRFADLSSTTRAFWKQYGSQKRLGFLKTFPDRRREKKKEKYYMDKARELGFLF